MLNEIITVLRQFRDKIYQFFSSRRDATMELVDSLSSNTNAKSVVELSKYIKPMGEIFACITLTCSTKVGVRPDKLTVSKNKLLICQA